MATSSKSPSMVAGGHRARSPGAVRCGVLPRGWTRPSEFDEYRLVRALGAGAMGVVWLAHDLNLDRPVAIKFLAAEHEEPDLLARFFIEARAVARLRHPNV